MSLYGLYSLRNKVVAETTRCRILLTSEEI